MRNSCAFGRSPTCETFAVFCEKNAASSMAVTWSWRSTHDVESSFQGRTEAGTGDGSCAARGADATASPRTAAIVPELLLADTGRKPAGYFSIWSFMPSAAILSEAPFVTLVRRIETPLALVSAAAPLPLPAVAPAPPAAYTPLKSSRLFKL